MKYRVIKWATVITILFYLFTTAVSTQALMLISEDSNDSINSLTTHDAMENARSVVSTTVIYESEPNGSLSTATKTYYDEGDEQYTNYGAIASTGDVDWWAIDLASQRYAKFTLSGIPTGCNYDMYLYSSSGTLLGSSTNTGSSNELIDNFWIPTGARYYIKISSSSGSSSSNYTFHAYCESYHGYAGFVKYGANKGVSALIHTPSSFPNVSDSGESAWVSTSMDTNNQWVQAGVLYYSSDTVFKRYVEYFQGGVYKKTTNGSQGLGVSIAYKVEYDSSDNKWHAYIDGYDKASCLLAQPNMPVQCNAETHKKYIQMGPFVFSSVQIKNYSGTWGNNTVLPSANIPYSAAGTATSFTVSGP